MYYNNSAFVIVERGFASYGPSLLAFVMVEAEQRSFLGCVMSIPERLLQKANGQHKAQVDNRWY